MLPTAPITIGQRTSNMMSQPSLPRASETAPGDLYGLRGSEADIDAGYGSRAGCQPSYSSLGVGGPLGNAGRMVALFAHGARHTLHRPKVEKRGRQRSAFSGQLNA